MLDEKLNDLKNLIPNFDEIETTKEEILNKKENEEKQIKFNFRKLSIVFSSFLILLILGISSIFIYNYVNNKTLEKNKEKFKEDLNKIVDEIEQSTVIQNNKDYVDSVIDQNVNSINKNTSSNEVKDIYTSTLDDVLNAIITEDASMDLLDQLFSSGKLYYSEFIGGGPTVSFKPSYSDLQEHKDKFRFYGSYNNASVLFVVKSEQIDTSLEILDYKFTYSYNFDIYVTINEITYKLSDINDLNYVIDNGILSKVDVDKIYQIHITWE